MRLYSLSNTSNDWLSNSSMLARFAFAAIRRGTTVRLTSSSPQYIRTFLGPFSFVAPSGKPAPDDTRAARSVAHRLLALPGLPTPQVIAPAGTRSCHSHRCASGLIVAALRDVILVMNWMPSIVSTQ